MKAKSRKHLLISSIAMLLVATVALGAATYAWFTQSPTATAQGLDMKATASNGLKIISQSHADKAGITIGSQAVIDGQYLADTWLNANDGATGTGVSFALTPASLDVTSATPTAYTTTGTSETDGAAPDGAEVSPLTPSIANGPVYKENVYCALVGASDSTAEDKVYISGITVTPGTATKLLPAVRFLITYKDTEVVAALANTAIGTETTITGTDSGTTYSTCDKGSGAFVSWTGYTEQADSVTRTVGTDGTDYFTIYAYLDGEDAACTSSNIQMSDIISDVSINFAIPTN